MNTTVCPLDRVRRYRQLREFKNDKLVLEAALERSIGNLERMGKLKAKIYSLQLKIDALGEMLHDDREGDQ